MTVERISRIVFVLTLLALTCGCTELQDVQIQNQTQRQRISELDSNLQSSRLKSGQLQRKLDTIDAVHKAEADALQQKVVALEDDVAKKKALISVMQTRLVYGGAAIPVELSAALEDIAQREPMVGYDPNHGIVKFESDLLFEKGSDVVAPAALGAISSLCKVLNSNEGKKFDVVVAGHTDDMRIGRAETREKHPTNWHLSGHRAISVLELMERNKISPKRMSIRGFGQHRPVAPNKPNKKGNPQNRRVEIYVVPKGL